MSAAISLCPFCGGEAALHKVSTEHQAGTLHNYFIVACKVCGVQTERFKSTIYQEDNGTVVIASNGADAAVAAWNSRPSEPDPEEGEENQEDTDE